MEKLKAHILVLPRWFALPAAMSAVALGCLIAGSPWWLTIVALLSGAFMMAYAHTFNTLLDYSWTGLDKGAPTERSRPKEYTTGQQPIAAGVLTKREVLLNGLVWLALSAGLAVPMGIWGSWWVWFPWSLVACCTFWYSWGKLHYCCETALGLGFGSFAVMFGAATSPNALGLFATACLAGLPFVLLWGFAAETIDQWCDSEPNWPRGLRNFGALVWKNNVSISAFTMWLIAIAYCTQLALIAGGVLAWQTGLSLAAFIPLSFCLLYIEKNLKVGVLWGLAGIFLHMVALTVGQAVG